MNYKDIAVKNEQRLKQENQRLKDLLHNTLVLLTEDFYEFHDLECEIGMTEEEYKEIME